MKLGIEKLLTDSQLKSELQGKRIGLLAHPASVNHGLKHSLDLMMADSSLNVTCGFGPQHGIKGDKQDNMIETLDEIDPQYKIPLYSLYGKVRRPSSEMLNQLDVIVVDLQDIGTRIYTFVTTLKYILEDAASSNRSVWVLDRPNPVGRPVEGLKLQKGWESFVGAGALPMRHGLTMGELALWFKSSLRLNVDLKVISMDGYNPAQGPGYGWPLGDLSWINPSPNAPNLCMARCFPGTVLLEGTTLSEGRGTTRPLEIVGAPDLPIEKILQLMFKMKSEWMAGCVIRPLWFEPTFHKHVGKLCSGFQIHVDDPQYQHDRFRPYRIMALFFKALKKTIPAYEIWRKFPYEYENDRLAIDLLNGGPSLREWVDDPTSSIDEFDEMNQADENAWLTERKPFLLY